MRKDMERDYQIQSARAIALDFLKATLDSDLSRLDEQRDDFTFELAHHPSSEVDGEAWERISTLAEEMLDARLTLLAIDLPEALIGVRTSTTLH